VSSIQALRDAGYGARYEARVPPEVREELFGLGAPAWLPLALADAHYGACDALSLPAEEIRALGARVAPAHASGAMLLLRAAKATGLTPWSLLTNAPRYWERMYEGAEITVHQDGPKDARIVIAGQPLARFAYWRTGFCGVLRSLTQALSMRSFVSDRVTGHGDMPIVTISCAWA